MRWLLPLLLFSSFAQATHIIGGNLSAEQISGDLYRVTLQVFKDCGPTAVDLNDIYIRAFSNENSNIFVTRLLPVQPGDTLVLGDECYSPPSLCVEEYFYSDTITLPANPSGYLLSAQVCCRNNAIDNLIDPAATGITWTAQIPPSSAPTQNSNPDLGPYPQLGFLCLDNLRRLDLSATDADGDSLAYELSEPLHAVNTTTLQPPKAPPYSPVTWKGAYSAIEPIAGNPSLKIDPITGILECQPDALGLYVFAYTVTEWRNGVKIGAVQRDLQLEVLPCIINTEPYFVRQPDSIYQAVALEEFCVQVSVVDDNPTDTLFVRSYFSASVDSLPFDPPTSLNREGHAAVGGKICWTPTCSDGLAGQELYFNILAYSKGCLVNDSIEAAFNVDVHVLPPDFEPLIPNVFTPNGDNLNDVFTLIEPLALPCVEDFDFRIFNRWGREVYRSTLKNLHWDGTFEGGDVSDGVYFYVTSGQYGLQQFQYKSFLTLSR